MVAQKNCASAKAIQHLLGVTYPTVGTWLHKLRRAIAAATRWRASWRRTRRIWAVAARARSTVARPSAARTYSLSPPKSGGAGRARLCHAPDHTGKAASRAADLFPVSTGSRAS